MCGCVLSACLRKSVWTETLVMKAKLLLLTCLLGSRNVLFKISCRVKVIVDVHLCVLFISLSLFLSIFFALVWFKLCATMPRDMGKKTNTGPLCSQSALELHWFEFALIPPVLKCGTSVNRAGLVEPSALTTASAISAWIFA